MKMPNNNYINGRKKEYRIVKQLKKEGFDIAQRSAGSHSPVDIFAINKKTKEICFVQAKPKDFAKSAEKKIYDDLNYLNEIKDWTVRFWVQ